MNFIVIFLLIFSLPAWTETLSIPDFSKISTSIKKNISGDLQEWCADCAQLKKRDPISLLKKNFRKMGGDETALLQALCFLDKHKSTNFHAKGNVNRKKGIQIQNRRYITIEDLNLPSKQPRLFVLDLQTGEVQASFSAHGGGQKVLGIRDVSKNVVKEVSNNPGSNLTARGFFITGIRYASGAAWKFSMKLHGLQEGINDNTYKRAIVMHPYPGVEEKLYSSEENIRKLDDLMAEQVMPLSWGCTMLSPKHASGIIDKIKARSVNEGGSLYYNYSSVEKGYGPNYCGDEKLMIK